MDLSIISLVIASISALATIVTALHLKHCKSACCESDCYKENSTPQTPLLTPKRSLHPPPPVAQTQTSLSIDC